MPLLYIIYFLNKHGSLHSFGGDYLYTSLFIMQGVSKGLTIRNKSNNRSEKDGSYTILQVQLLPVS